MQFQKLNDDQMNVKQREVAKEIGSRLPGGVSGPYQALLHSPLTADLVRRLDECLRFELRIPERLRILAVLVAAGQFRGQDVLPFLQIEAPAESGLPPETVNAIKNHTRPENMRKDEALVYDFVSELVDSGRVSDSLFERGREMLGREICLELVKVAGLTIFFRNTMNATGQFFQKPN
jgi:4-carboxymuconolactone decarboxylase